MAAFHAKLGVPTVATPGPLVATNGAGQPFAVWPSFANGLLLVGSTGNGKSSLLRYMVAGMVQPDRGPKALHLADGKFSGAFLMFSGVPGVASIETTPEGITDQVRGFFTVVEERYAALSDARQQALASRGKPAYVTPGDTFLVLDEYLNWVLALPDKERKEIIAKLTRIGSIGREVRCRLVLATQRPGTKDGGETGLPSNLKAQLRCRVAALGRVGLDSIEARMCFDDDSAAAKVNPHATEDGIGVARVGAHEVLFWTPWIADPTDPDTSDADRQAAWDRLP
jgi:hypothetical protein